jgi:RNA polymerase sigma-70 factor (ECF subfamily)
MHMFQLPRSRADRFFNRMKTVQKLHIYKCTLLLRRATFGRILNIAQQNHTRVRVFPVVNYVIENVMPTAVHAHSLANRTEAQASQIRAESEAIAAGLKRNDENLLNELIETYQHRLMRYLLFLTGKRETADDLFQETWMRVLQRGSQYNGKARFDTWLFTIARNLVIDLSRKRTMASLDEMSESTDEERPFEAVSSAATPLDVIQSGETSAHIMEALLHLEANYREVLILRFQEEMSLEEIAKVTRSPLSTVKSRLYRGMAALKPHIEETLAPRERKQDASSLSANLRTEAAK